MTEFAIVGAGWRAEFFLRVARELSGRFHVCAVAEADPVRAGEVRQKWGVRTAESLTQALQISSPEFVVLCLPAQVLPDVIEQAVDEGVPVLAETFPAADVESIGALYRRVRGGRVQMSEQYWLQPIHAARLALIREGKLGEVSQAQISVGHGYHGVSLIRKYLGIGFEECDVTAWRWTNPIVRGPGRAGDPEAEELVQDEQDLALFDFHGKWGLFDFTGEQYFSSIRAPRVLVRGPRGELMNDEIHYLTDYKTPVRLTLRREADGENGSMRPPHIVGITAGERWIYRNEFGAARLSDDEIALAQVLAKMAAYAKGGPSFYSLEEGCQDQYLALMMEQAIRTGRPVTASRQVWAPGKEPSRC